MNYQSGHRNTVFDLKQPYMELTSLLYLLEFLKSIQAQPNPWHLFSLAYICALFEDV